MRIPPSPFHALPALPLLHHHSFSQGKETKYNHCSLPKGRGTVAAETGLSRWLSVLGSQTLGLPQHMEDTNTGTCHAFEWLKTDRQRADVQTEIFAFLLLIYRWWTPWHWGTKKWPDLKPFISLWSENFQLSCEISPADALGKKKKQTTSFLFHVWPFL